MLSCHWTASRDDTTKLWSWKRAAYGRSDDDGQSGLQCQTVLSGQAGVRSVQCDDDKIVTSANDSTVCVWNFPEGSEDRGEREPEPQMVHRRLLGSDSDEDSASGSQGGDPEAEADCADRLEPPIVAGALSPLRTAASPKRGTGTDRPRYQLQHTAQVRMSWLHSTILLNTVSDTQVAAQVPRARFYRNLLASICGTEIKIWDFAGWHP
jgi:hypothetical protein